jgi:L-fuculose-phosphate aldolase
MLRGMTTQTSPKLELAREQVAAASRRLAAGGLVVDTAGNVSVRVGDRDAVRDRVAITPTGLALAAMTAEQVAIVDLDGNVVDGELVPSSELYLHLGVYERYGAGAVVHTHAPMATAVSCVLDELPCVHYWMLAIGGDVPVAPFATFGTQELARVTLDALEGRIAALMANHGAITYGHDMRAAVNAMEVLEWAAGVYCHAAPLGTPRVLEAAERQAVIAAALERGYGSTREVQT